MNETNIGWVNPTEKWSLTHTWNPAVGCKNNCYYCYARALHNKRHEYLKKGKKLPPQYKKPYSEIQLLNERLNQPTKKRNKCNIFVGSMCDLFSQFIPDDFIRKIVQTCEDCFDKHRFMFLTQHPERYHDFQFPRNCYLGATVRDKHQAERIHHLKNLPNSTFLSIEPMMSDFWDVDLSDINLLIVGPMTKVDEPIIPEIDWIDSISMYKNVHFKSAMKDYFPDIVDIF